MAFQSLKLASVRPSVCEVFSNTNTMSSSSSDSSDVLFKSRSVEQLSFNVSVTPPDLDNLITPWVWAERKSWTWDLSNPCRIWR